MAEFTKSNGRYLAKLSGNYEERSKNKKMPRLASTKTETEKPAKITRETTITITGSRDEIIKYLMLNTHKRDELTIKIMP